MESAVVGLLAETPVHAGSGRSLGVIDLPVAREGATDLPVVTGSSMKGALRDGLEQRGGEDEANQLFGAPERAGDVLVSEGRLVLLPVRSIDGAYRWATSPLLLERLQRDFTRADRTVDLPALAPGPGRALVAEAGRPPSGETLVLEERSFRVRVEVLDDVLAAVEPLMAHEPARCRLARQLVVLDDDDLTWFARYGLAVVARNVLDDGTKTSTNLWYEESLPPDTLLSVLVAGRTAEALEQLLRRLREWRYLQVGGNETVGQGWMALAVPEAQR